MIFEEKRKDCPRAFTKNLETLMIFGKRGLKTIRNCLELQ
ncbi:hypothetical protein D922_04298 [Enterococcus faecalis 06-MB-DW-09]|nr:hypothetical protein D922_04298 [Enterococcus faecalis 06-MB-DW-09]